VLIGDNKDTWTDARKALLTASPNNEKALRKIESTMIIVALYDTKPIFQEDNSCGTWAGDGCNRLYDKHQCAYLRLLYYD
jgi:carnitine O-acetyltransferase